MANNNRVELNGNLGQDAKTIESNGKKFISLSLATTDSYKDEVGNWHDKETLWHEVLVFRPAAIQFAKDLKKGDRVEVVGSLSYRPFKDEQGYTRHQANIIAGYVQKVTFEKKDKSEDEAISQAFAAQAN